MALGVQFCGTVKAKMSCQFRSVGMTFKAFGILPDLYLPIKKPTFSYTATILASKNRYMKLNNIISFYVLPIWVSSCSVIKSVCSAILEKTASASWISVIGKKENLTGANLSIDLLYLVMPRIETLKAVYLCWT
jgi:hypothetical protein